MQLPTDKLSVDAINNINTWLTVSRYVAYKPQLESMINDGQWQILEDSFFKNIEFGTGGIRGTTGIGSNRINDVTIGQSTQAVCDYAVSLGSEFQDMGIVIAFDTRLSSVELSKISAGVVAANGFNTYIFDSFRSTPELSFAVRHLKCAAGIVISASHNPPADNGFKVYWSDGGQIVSPHDKGIMDAVAKISEIKSLDYAEAVDDEKIIVIGKDVDDAYLTATTAQSLSNDREIKIVYSPLHGTGQTNVLPTLRKAGFKEISLVTAQMTPDGNFPTISGGKPNPEEYSANDMAVEQMMKESADIAITNDPDADRIGVIIRQDDRPVYLNGNQSAVLATDYTFAQLKIKGELIPKMYVVKTIVTTDMLNALTDYYGVKIYDNLLIGFKYIGALIRSKENTDEQFVIGCEESYGLLKGDYVRDKDGATGTLPIVEYAAQLKKQGKTLYDKLLELYKQHGIYVEKLENMAYPGANGFEQMKRIMTSLRQSAPSDIAGNKVTAMLDYSTLTRIDLLSGTKTPIDCDKGDVLVLEFGDKSNRISIRPSGTEPKIKFYVQWRQNADPHKEVFSQYDEISKKLDITVSELRSYLSSL